MPVREPGKCKGIARRCITVGYGCLSTVLFLGNGERILIIMPLILNVIPVIDDFIFFLVAAVLADFKFHVFDGSPHFQLRIQAQRPDFIEFALDPEIRLIISAGFISVLVQDPDTDSDHLIDPVPPIGKLFI